MANVTLTQEQYLALISLARNGSPSPDQRRILETFLKDIDATNGVTRYLLWVQWQELKSPLPPTTNFPAVWPPEMRVLLERTDRPIASADILAAVKQKANDPTNILVTKDPGALVGWAKIADFFIT